MDAHFNLVLAAAARLAGQAHRTPVLESRALNQRAGAGVWLKCENFQRTGSFKFRGAYNALASLREIKPTPEVLTYSSGNHAQAMALAGRLLQVKVNVVMPENAPQVKRAATEAYGARVISYDPEKTTREEIAAALGAERGLPIVPPYDDLAVVAGQATAALEFMAQADDLEFLLVPCGGGGLLSGCAIAARRLSSRCRVIGIEPELADDATRSFRTGTLHTVSNPPTIADGTRTPSLGKLTFPLVRQYVDDMQTVPESAIVEAVQFLLFRLKLLVEPSGALGVAALLSGVVKPKGKTGVILSGGNIDAETLGRIIKEILDG